MVTSLYKVSFFLFFTFYSLYIFAQSDSAKIYELGAVRLKGEQQYEDSFNQISSKKMQDMNLLTVSEALKTITGINQANVGDRNESVVYLRGFDLRQVPVYIDGVPVYVPFDGYVDLARFTTFDLSQIQVSKGGSSVIYGANTLGGAINLISRKPTEKFEGDALIGWMNGGVRGNVNVGGIYKKFYYQLGASYFEREFYPLSKSYKPNKLENGGRRDDAYNKDQKINLKIGFIPTKRMEHSINFLHQSGEKGNPLYAGNDSLNPRLTKSRYWKWPAWNKSSAYYLSEIKWGSSQYFKTRLFYDQFKNSLESYDDKTYSSMKKGSSFFSNYNDYTYGGNIEYGNKNIKNHFIKTALHYKRDVHREDEGKPNTKLQFQDYTGSLGVEDFYKINKKWSVLGGLSYNVRQSLRADKFVGKTTAIEQFASNKSAAINAQMELTYKVNTNNTFFIKLARKTRFATIKDRYSYKLGTAIPNPDLKAENALHFELGNTLQFAKRWTMNTAIFYSAIDDVIQTVNNAFKDSARLGMSQQQNTGNAIFYGAELALNCAVNKQFNISLNYTYIERKNLSNPNIKFVNVPNHNAFLTAQYSFKKGHWLLLNNGYNSARYSTSYGVKAAAYNVTNLKAHFAFNKAFSLEAGINNLLDQNYAFLEGFPEAGRNYLVNLRMSF